VLLNKLNALLAKTSIILSDHQKQQLISYVEMLNKWNKAYNLTSVRDPNEMIVKHILDSLVVAPHLEGDNYIDVGTGPGLPGVVLAIAHPDKHFVLMDSLGKRIRFLNQVKLNLKLTNITPVQSRVEKYIPEIPFDGVLSRAFASLKDMVDWCQHLVDHSGCFIALKGQFPEQEIEQLPASIVYQDKVVLTVPELDAERHLIILKKN
jgi:16S rRNA (guanine527-N7)-methyltransferase